MGAHLVSFRAQLRDPSRAPVHERMVGEMKRLAEDTGGLLEWRDATDGLEYWGFVVFSSGDTAMAWKSHPDHGRIHNQGEEAVYEGFRTQVFELVREAEWQRADGGT